MRAVHSSMLLVLTALALCASSAQGAVCDKCNIPVSSGGCKCDNNCNCKAGSYSPPPPPAASPCDKCNIPVASGGCKCDNNCNCKAPATSSSPPPPPPRATTAPLPPPPPPPASNPAPGSSCSLRPSQTATAFTLTSLWENSVPTEQYAYCEALGDGRGYTAGIVGFCTSLSECGDAVQVVQRFVSNCGSAASSSALAGYLSALQSGGGIGDGQVQQYSGFCAAWNSAASQACFHSAQNYYQNTVYVQPSQAYADGRHLQYALSRAVLYDSIIQHGDGTDSSSIGAMLMRADVQWRSSNGGGSGPLPAKHTNAQEVTWLSIYLNIRLKVLQSDPNTWGQSTSRVYAYQNLVSTSQFALSGTVTFKAAPDWPNTVSVPTSTILPAASANCSPLS